MPLANKTNAMAFHVIVFALLVSADYLSADSSLGGVHLSLSESGTLRCMWRSSRSWRQESSATCIYGFSSGALHLRSAGRSYTYTAGGFVDTLHEAVLVDLPTNTTVYYRCGTNSLTPEFNFTYGSAAVAEELDEARSIGVVADMGIVNSDKTVACLKELAQTGKLALIVHAGDISYADSRKPSENNSYVWRDFMDLVQAAAAFVPYMTTPGNHEAQFDFSAYVNHFHSPSSESNSSSPFWYSFDHLGVHFTMISTEHDFTNGSLQSAWIRADLAKANSNRALVPWLVVVGHRPLYCSSVVETSRCVDEAPIYRANLEWLLHMFKVDLYVCGHNHQYERSYPVLNRNRLSTNYTNPEATVYIVNGAAGNEHPIDPTFLPQALVPWRAAHGHLFETSWLEMTASRLQLRLRLRTSEQNQVTDEFVITRT